MASKAKAGAETTLRAFAVQDAKQKEFKLMDYKPAPLGPKDIQIRVVANGLCYTDIHMRDDDWSCTAYPLVPGHEVVGIVEAKGDQVTSLELGDRVGFGWIKASCRSCLPCLRGNENLCHEGITGLIVGEGNFGGFQPHMRGPADFAYKIPDSISSTDAAPLLCAGITVYAPLRKFIKHPGMTVAVLGVGGLGHLGVQYAAAMGAVVTAIARQADKAKEAKALGAAEFVVLEEALEKRKNAFDIVLNTACGQVDNAKVIGMLRPDGVMIQCGIPGGGAEITVPLGAIVGGQKSIAGSLVGGRADMKECLDFSAARGIKPMVEVFKLSKINEAIARVESGKARYRVVMETDLE